MTQTLEVRCLTSEQIETTINNICVVRGLSKPIKLFEGKPSFSKENMDKYNLDHYTKFADKYIIWAADDEENNIKNIYITFETNRFDKQHILAIIGLYHLFEKYVTNSRNHPYVFICPAYVVTPVMFTHIPSNTIPCCFRFFSLCDVYPMLGSKNNIYKLTFDYKILQYSPTYNNRDYIVVDSGDPIVKALNGIDGELLVCKRIIYDMTAYSDYQIRRIVSNREDPDIIDPSGICNLHI